MDEFRKSMVEFLLEKGLVFAKVLFGENSKAQKPTCEIYYSIRERELMCIEDIRKCDACCDELAMDRTLSERNLFEYRKKAFD